MDTGVTLSLFNSINNRYRCDLGHICVVLLVSVQCWVSGYLKLLKYLWCQFFLFSGQQFLIQLVHATVDLLWLGSIRIRIDLVNMEGRATIMMSGLWLWLRVSRLDACTVWELSRGKWGILVHIGPHRHPHVHPFWVVLTITLLQ